MHILSKLEEFLPIWIRLVQPIEATPYQWVTEEAETDNEIIHLHKHGRRRKKRNSKGSSNNPGEPKSRCFLWERVSWR